MERFSETRRTLTALLALIALMLAGLLGLLVDQGVKFHQQDQFRRQQIKRLTTQQQTIVDDVHVLKVEVEGEK